MKDLKATRGGRIVREMIAEGEHETQDFKFSISDARKIARSLSAFANHRGGRLLIGVKDNGVIAGVRSEEDIYVVELAAERYCRPPQQVEFKAYSVDGTARVIVAEIAASNIRPVYAGEPDGSWRAYYRVADENIVAHPLMLRAWENDANGVSSTFALGGVHTHILELLGRRGTLTSTRDVALSLHISQAAADDAVVQLAAMGLVRFELESSKFTIKLA